MMAMAQRYENCTRTSVLILVGKDVGILIEIVPEIERCDEVVLVSKNQFFPGRDTLGQCHR